MPLFALIVILCNVAEAAELLGKSTKDGLTYYNWKADDGFEYVEVVDDYEHVCVTSTSGTVIIPFSRKYNSIFYFNEKDHPDKGYFKVEKDGYTGAVDLKGNEIVSPNKYKSLIYISGNYKGKLPNSDEWEIATNGVSKSSTTKDLAVLDRQARDEFKNGNYDKAKDLFYEIFMTDKTQLDALSSYACCLNNLGYYDSAIEVYDMVLSLDSDNEYALSNKEISENNKRKIANQQSEYSNNQSNDQSIWDALGNASAAFLNAMQSNGQGGYNNYDGYNSYGSGYNSGSNSSSSNYEQQYRNWERRAEQNYNSLTNLGYSATSKNGSKKGNSGQGASVSNYNRMKSALRDAQREMRNIRQKARQAGVNIPQSKWETATVSY